MLKNFLYGGGYHDENVSVSMLLENPMECGFEEGNLVFSIHVRRENESSNTSMMRLEDFTFYIMDENNRLYNTKNLPCPLPCPDALLYSSDNDELIRPDGLILTDFKPEFLFQNLRIVFYYQPYQKFKIIELSH